MILVTGATGCLGSNLTKRLVESGNRVAILRLEQDPQLTNLGAFRSEVEHRIGDVRDPASVRRALNGITKVYHLAGVAVPFNRLRRHMMEVNVRGTDHVLASARVCGVQRVVLTSSSSAVGIPEDGTTANEEYEYNGTAFRFSYMHSKHRAEAVALRHSRDGLDVVIVNPTAVMAPGGNPRSSWTGTIAALKKGRLFFYPSGGVGLVSRSDMVDGHIKAMNLGRSGQRYILNSLNITYRDLAALIAEVVGCQPPEFAIPNTLLSTLGVVNSCINFFRHDPMTCSPLSRENVPLLIRKIYYDQSKALTELGITQTPIRTAIEEVYTWWLTESERARCK